MGIGIFIGVILFGTCALVVYLCKEYIDDTMSKKTQFFIYPTVVIASLMFHPMVLVLAIIIFALAILCFPITYKIIKNS
jgi:hypothetical protein